MNIKILVKKNELLYFSAFIIWIGWYMIARSSLFGDFILSGSSRYLLEGICALILIYKMIYCDKYTVRELDIISVVTIITIIATIISDNEMLFIILLLILAAKNISFRKIVKVSIVEISLLVIVIMVSCELGILANYVYIRSDGTLRNSFGFKYTLFLGAYYLNIVLMYIYLRSEKLKYYEYIVILIINYYIYRQTDNRTVYMLIYLSLVLVTLFIKVKLPKKLNWITNQVFSYCVPFCALFSIILSISYNKSIGLFRELNKILEGRLSLGKYAYLEYGLNLFGKKIIMVGNGGTDFYNGNISKIDYNYIDNSYLQIALRYGIIILLILCIAFTLVCINGIKKRNIALCICIFIIAIQSIINDQFILPPYNIFLITLGGLLNEMKKISKAKVRN